MMTISRLQLLVLGVNYLGFAVYGDDFFFLPSAGFLSKCQQQLVLGLVTVRSVEL